MKRKIAFATLVFSLAAVSVSALFMLRRANPTVSPVAEEGLISLIGGLRSVVSEAVWIRAGRLQRECQYVELAQLASLLARLEPHEPEVWSFAAWNLSYNVASMMPDADGKWRWIVAGMRLLRDDGLRLNPGSPQICRDLAFLFEVKFLKNVDSNYAVYTEKWREMASDVMRRDAWEELGMDRAVMAEVEKKYGVRDWTSPFSSSIYWAHAGLARAEGNDRAFLVETIRQCRTILASAEGPVSGRREEGAR